MEIRNASDRGQQSISNLAALGLAAEQSRSLHILWLYPDVLNLHGGRGDMMALLHVADLLELPIEIRRCDRLDETIDFAWADMICLNSGELKCAPEIITALQKQREALNDFIARGGMLWAIASSGAVLANQTELLDGTVTEGLGLLNMNWRERESVWGDDIWFSLPDGLQIIGNQIQVADVFLEAGQEAFGTVLYGRGNCKDGSEGARSGNVIFTNCLGPMLVKNPKLTAQWLKEAAAAAGIEVKRELKEEDVEIENRSFALIQKFIEAKMAK